VSHGASKRKMGRYVSVPPPKRLKASDYFATVRRLTDDPEVVGAVDRAEEQLQARPASK